MTMFLRDVLDGLRAKPKRLPPKYFYDRNGSSLFDAICELPEYYVTRTELALLRATADEIATRLATGNACRILEPGAGSLTKPRVLLRALGRERCVRYVPVDIAGEHLEQTAKELRRDLPWLDVVPWVGDFSVALPQLEPCRDARTVVYFPGSTLGNFEPDEARALLSRFRRCAGPDGLVLLGLDLKKDPAELHAAYNDARGVTAAFNKNVLVRINAELGADFELARFHHYAFYAPPAGRIEMHLVSKHRQTVHVGNEAFTFEAGESICTEHSYKYDVSDAARLASSAGLRVERSWLDAGRRFGIFLLRCA